MDAIQSFQKTIKRHRLFSKDSKLLIAVSGGADSMALCHLCQSLDYDIAVAHMNYQLRGADADGDAVFVEKKAMEWKVPFHLKTVDCQKYASDNNIAIQEAARDLRYAFFEELMTMYGYDYLLTAHHAKDNVETMIYTLTKGASIKALRGIPLTRDHIVRPLLYTSSADLSLYVRTHKIEYRTDSSNQDTKYRRNFIRHEIIPKLEAINPNLESTMSSTATLGAGYEHLIDSLLKSSKSDFLTSRSLDLRTYGNSHARIAWLYEHIQILGFNVSDVENIWSVYHQGNGTGKLFHSGQHSLIIDRDLLRILKNDDQISQAITIDSLELEHPRISISRTNAIKNGRVDKDVMYISQSKISFPLTLRTWEPGDRFRPLGMNGKSKKIKDYLTDQKVGSHVKRQVEVLLSNGEIIWVVGHRKAHGFHSSTEDSDIIRLEIKSP